MLNPDVSRIDLTIAGVYIFGVNYEKRFFLVVRFMRMLFYVARSGCSCKGCDG